MCLCKGFSSCDIIKDKNGGNNFKYSKILNLRKTLIKCLLQMEAFRISTSLCYLFY